MSLGQGDIGWAHSVAIYTRAYQVLTQLSRTYVKLLLPPDDPRLQLLGHGFFGNVYPTRSASRVLKLTADASELIIDPLQLPAPLEGLA